MTKCILTNKEYKQKLSDLYKRKDHDQNNLVLIYDLYNIVKDPTCEISSLNKNLLIREGLLNERGKIEEEFKQVITSSIEVSKFDKVVFVLDPQFEQEISLTGKCEI